MNGCSSDSTYMNESLTFFICCSPHCPATMPFKCADGSCKMKAEECSKPASTDGAKYCVSFFIAFALYV